MLTIVGYAGEYWSLDNRLLAVFPFLQMLGDIGSVKCAQVDTRERTGVAAEVRARRRSDRGARHRL